MNSEDLAVEDDPHATCNGLFNLADSVKEAIGPLHSVTQPDTHPITRATAQGITETNEEEMMEIFSYQKIAVFEPSLPAIEEEHTLSQTYSETDFHANYTAHPITLAISQAISERVEVTMMNISRCQRMPLFEPSLHTIEEEYYMPSQTSSGYSLCNSPGKTENPEISFNFSARLRRVISIRDLRDSVAKRGMATPQEKDSLYAMMHSSTKRSGPFSSFATPKSEATYKYTELPRLPQKNRYLWERVIKKVWQTLQNMQGGHWNYVAQSVWGLA